MGKLRYKPLADAEDARVMEFIGRNLKYLRIGKGLDIRGACDDCKRVGLGYGAGDLINLENGRKSVTLVTLRKLAQYYGVSMTSLIDTDYSKIIQVKEEEISRTVGRRPDPYHKKHPKRTF